MRSKRVFIVGLVFFLLPVLTSCSQNSTNQSDANLSRAAATTQTIPDTSWIPAGFSSNADYSWVSPGIAFQIQNAKQDPQQQKVWCGGFEAVSYCSFVAVVANTNCAPTGSLQLFDKLGNVIGQAVSGDQNSSNPVALTQGQKTVLVFRLDNGVAKSILTSLSCA